ncbi:receptor-like protein EIX2 [Silene latifolia]|uniref:receptor-like protein EIX2 n=1 Tax=Silene latifolia TaxID=37657 RepID=UPI003D76EB8C
MQDKMRTQFTTKLYNHLLVLLLLCIWLTYLSSHARSGCMESERDALLEFKRGIRVDNCGFLDSWGVTQDCCLWSGIECHNHSGHVIALRLPTPYDYIPKSCLEGTISISLLNLTQLKYLDLSYNYFGEQIPKFIGSLSNLEHLDLSHARFIGVIPHEIGNLTKLTYLDISSFNYDYYDYYPNNMRVENLLWLSQLTLVSEVNLGGIDLSIATNNWLSIVNNLPLLHDLRLDDCNLYLRMPSSLSYINSSTTLGVLSLSYNNLNDASIFEWLSNLGGVETSLVYLDLSFNDQVLKNNFQMSRVTMNFLGSLCSLKTLIIPSTGLNYKFSDLIESLSICSHKSLVLLGLDLNQLWGSISDNIGNLYNLRTLVVGDNQLNGSISQGALGGLPMLEKLRLSSNFLKGVLNHDHLSNLSKLRDLNLDDNTELVVNISDNWVPPFQLNRLRLRSCKVGPNFPTWLITQKNLTILEISNTSISDTIPISFFNSLSSKLELLSMSRNMMYGVLPNVPITFEASPWIDLSSNNFSGEIPLYLRNVSVLHLNNNHFSEGLVPFLCPRTKMPLTSLDLSNNSFSDKLPDCWGYFDKLKVLHLENNNLWGNLPISFCSKSLKLYI